MSNDPHTKLVARAADLSRSRPPKWAWQDRVLVGYLNLLLGNEGIGKGTLLAWMIARWTEGKLPGAFHGHPISVGVLGDEDDFDGIWTPRLHVAGADLTRVFQIERSDGEQVEVGKDRSDLHKMVEEKGIKVLVYDQLLDNLDGDINERRQREVRKALRPVRALASEIGLATIGALHPNKKAASFRELVSDSVAFNAVAKSNLLLADHPDDEDRRVVVVGKGNFAKKPKSFEFRIDQESLAANGELFIPTRVLDIEYGDFEVGDLVGTDPPKVDKTKVGKACSIISDQLPHDDRFHLARPLIDACADQSIDERTANRAKSKLELEQSKTTTMPAEALWRWPLQTGQTGQTGHSGQTKNSVHSGSKARPDTDRSCAQSDLSVLSDLSRPDRPDRPDTPDEAKR